MKAIVAANSRQLNHTNETLVQLNRIVEYFGLNESAVSKVVDKQDANVSVCLYSFRLLSFIGFRHFSRSLVALQVKMELEP